MLISIISLAGFSFWWMRSHKKGKVLSREFIASAIKGNQGGEDPKRRLTIYLPPGYEQGNERYSVIYYLHGFNANESELNNMRMNELLDAAIEEQRIKPVILVVPGSSTTYGGSFYSNSSLTGAWADYIAKDVVAYVDQNFRTLADKHHRGLAGHSMGGNGALKISMLFPDVFGSVYALSPSVLNWGEEFSYNNKGFRIIQTAKNKTDIFNDLYANILLDMARTYSPNAQKPPYYAELPVEFNSDSMQVRTDIVALWEKQFPMVMMEEHLADLKGLSGLKIDWGKDDEFPHIPFTCLQFSKKLKENGIQHEAEEYIGTHGNMLGGANGRISLQMLPFFDQQFK